MPNKNKKDVTRISCIEILISFLTNVSGRNARWKEKDINNNNDNKNIGKRNQLTYEIYTTKTNDKSLGIAWRI